LRMGMARALLLMGLTLGDLHRSINVKPMIVADMTMIYRAFEKKDKRERRC
jgi:hypothetical protein